MILETRNLTKRYNGVLALDNVNLKVAEGQFVSIMGPSGSGKTTLLNLIGALDAPSEGEVIINGKSLKDVKDMDAFRSREIGFIFQFQNLIPTLTARENVEVPMYELDVPRKLRVKTALDLLASVGLKERADHKPHQLSGGERQRVAIARALVNDPSIILADEPTGELDSATGLRIIDLIKKICRERRKTIILVTHDPDVARRADRMIFLRDGRIQRDEALKSELFGDLTSFMNSSLGKMILMGEPVEDELLEKVGIFKDGDLGRHGLMLRDLLTQASSIDR